MSSSFIQRTWQAVRQLIQVVIWLVPLSSGVLDAGVTLDADGWTSVVPSSDTRKVYVSSSAGNDANHGRSRNAAVRTIAKGKSLLRDGFADWLLLKKGDTWTNESLGQWRLSGRSEQEPLLISSYGTGRRPLLKSTDAGISAVHRDGEDISNVAIIGIHFYAYKHDYDSPDFDAAAIPSLGILWRQSGENFLIEDVYVDSYRNRHTEPEHNRRQ